MSQPKKQPDYDPEVVHATLDLDLHPKKIFVKFDAEGLEEPVSFELRALGGGGWASGIEGFVFGIEDMAKLLRKMAADGKIPIRERSTGKVRPRKVDLGDKEP